MLVSLLLAYACYEAVSVGVAFLFWRVYFSPAWPLAVPFMMLIGWFPFFLMSRWAN